MDIQEIIAEIIYIGIVAEKGRCYNAYWSFAYKKTLKLHIKSLYKLSLLLDKPSLDAVSAVNEFISLSSSHPEISRFYSFQKERIFVTDITISHKKFRRAFCVLKILFSDLLDELNKCLPNKEKVYYMLNALHNLPRVYFNGGKSLCGISKCHINENEALTYSFLDLNSTLRQNYKEFCDIE